MITNAQKVAAAQELLTFIKTIGFDDAYLVFCDQDGTLYESIEDVAKENFGCEITVGIHLVLDEEVSFVIEEEEDFEDSPRITFIS